MRRRSDLGVVLCASPPPSAAGFAVGKVDDYKYRLVSIGNGVKDLHNIVYFSPEEAFIVNRLIDSLDPFNSLKNELKRKLSAIYDRTSIADFTDRPSSARKVQALVEAIRDKKVVRLLAYSSSCSGNTGLLMNYLFFQI